MLNRPAKVATTGAALAVTSFGVGLLHDILPTFFWNFATAVGATLLIAICGTLLVAYYVATMTLVAAVCLLCNPLGLIASACFLLFIRSIKR